MYIWILGVKPYLYRRILELPTSSSSALCVAIVAPVVRQGTIPLLRYIRRGLSDFNRQTLRGAIYFRDSFLGWPVLERLTKDFKRNNENKPEQL